jgi:hypothetical protein
VTSKRFYAIAGLMALASWIWTAWAYFHPEGDFTPCLFRNMTGLPCPSCGSTHAVIALLHGNVAQSLLCHPLGIVIFLTMISGSITLLHDLFASKDLSFKAYILAERLLSKPSISIPVFVLLLINWFRVIQEAS